MVGWIIVIVGFLMSVGLTVLATKCKVFNEKNEERGYTRSVGYTTSITHGPIHVGSLIGFLVCFWMLCSLFVFLFIGHTEVMLVLTGIALAIWLTVFGILAAFDPNSSSAKFWSQIRSKISSLLTKPDLPTNP
jgi:hypothetical protein